MHFTAAQLADREDEMLASYAVTSRKTRGRQQAEKPSEFRTPFQRDRDRIIHSKAFRRLKHKTQVFPALTGDHYRDRLTHSLAVAQIARDISRTLGLNEDLAESIALAHDLGHTPFGHSGEETLNECLKKHGQSFEHNEQSKRVVESIENPYPDRTGLNLSFETIDGMIKHQSSYDQVEMKIRIHPSLEAQVVNLSDEIAYNCHDLDDGLRAGILTHAEVSDLELWKESESILNKPSIETYHQLYSNTVMKQYIEDVTAQTEKNLAEQKISSLEDVYACKTYLVSFSQGMKEKNLELRTTLMQKFYLHNDVQEKMVAGRKIIADLFEHFVAEKSRTIEEIRDYIAGMTDNFAYNLHRELTEKNAVS